MVGRHCEVDKDQDSTSANTPYSPHCKRMDSSIGCLECDKGYKVDGRHCVPDNVESSSESGEIWLSDNTSAARSFELSDDTCKAIDAECSKDDECCYSCCEKGLGKKTGKCTDGDMCHMGRIIIWIIFI